VKIGAEYHIDKQYLNKSIPILNFFKHSDKNKVLQNKWHPKKTEITTREDLTQENAIRAEN